MTILECFGRVAVLLSLTVLVPGAASAEAPSCASVFVPAGWLDIPARLGLQQVGRLDGVWLRSRYSYDRDRWHFSDRLLDGQEIAFHQAEQDERMQLMTFTYDILGRRAFRGTKIPAQEFLKTLAQEDWSASDWSTSYFGFWIDGQVIATAKTTVQRKSQSGLLPVFQKHPSVETKLEEKLGAQNWIEIGRLAKTNIIQLETIFSALSHSLLQQNLGSGYIVGHTAPAQASIYEKLGFTVSLPATEVAVDQVVVTMPLAAFVTRFPPRHYAVTRPERLSWLDETYLVPTSTEIPRKFR